MYYTIYITYIIMINNKFTARMVDTGPANLATDMVNNNLLGQGTMAHKSPRQFINQCWLLGAISNPESHG